MGFFFPEEEREKKRLKEIWKKDAEQAMQEAERLVQEALRADRLREALRVSLIDCRQALKTMADLARAAEAKLRGESTFFVSTNADAKHFPAFCTTLQKLEVSEQELHRAMRLQAAADRILGDRQMASLRAEEFLLAGGLGEEEQNSRAENLLAELRQDSARIATLLMIREATSKDLSAFCGQTLPLFLERISRAADVEGEGKGFRAAAVLEMLGAFVFAAEGLAEGITGKIEKTDSSN